MNATLTDQLGGLAWSEDPDGRNLAAMRVDIDGDSPRSIAVQRRGPISIAQFGDADTLDAVRRALLEAETELGGPSVLRWRAYGSGNVDAVNARLIDEPLPWGSAPGQGMPLSPDEGDSWSRANAGEVMPNVMTPLSWWVMRESLERGFQAPWGEWTANRRFVALFDGYVYFNVGLMLELIEQRLGLPSAHFLEAVGGPQDAAVGSQQLHWSRFLRQLPFMLRSIREQRRLPERWPDIRTASEAERDRLRALNLDELSDRRILRELTRSAAQSDLQVVFLMEAQTAVFGAVQALLWMLDRFIGPDQRHLALSLLQGLPDVRTQDGNIALRRIAERAASDPAATAFVRQHDADSLWPALQDSAIETDVVWLRDAMQEFFDEYGHRAAGELEAAEPRWVEQPSLILGTFRDYVLQPESESTDDLIARQRQLRVDAEAEIRRQIGGGPIGRTRWLLIREQIRQAQTLQPLRENPKFSLLEISLQQRRLWLELAARWIERGVISQPDDVFFLHFDELTSLMRRANEPVVAARMRSRIRRRRAQYDAWTSATPPPLRDRFGAPDPEPSAPEAPAPSQPAHSDLPIALRGIAASSGSAEGIAHVAESAQHGRKLVPGQILVARFTDPGWTPLFPLAAAVVTEIGGVLSHGAIVAREFGIPAVVNVQQVTQQVKSGDRLRVDGSSGQVTILERS